MKNGKENIIYIGGVKEYNRLEKVSTIATSLAIKDAAYCSVSSRVFQIMGDHFESLVYHQSIDNFVSKMYEHEREHLEAFGQFITINSFRSKKIIDWLRKRNWSSFAHAYNGLKYQ